MSNDAPGPRPRQVTLGAWAVVVASVLLVASVFDAMAGLHSVQTRDAVTKALTSGSGQGLGISVDDALTLMRVALFVAGAGAAVTAVLGVFALQRHQAARVVLTAAAVPVVLTTPVVMTASGGGVFGLLVGIAVGMLWAEPARDWYAGRPAPRRVPSAALPPSRSASAPVRRTDQPDPAERRVPPPWPPPGPRPAAWAPPLPRAPAAHALPAAAASRHAPASVRAACVLTWVFSGLTATVYAVLVVAIAVDRDGVLDLLRDNPALGDSTLDDRHLVAALVAVSALVLVWCILASLLAALTWRRHRTARTLLVVSVAIAGLVELAAMPYSLAHFVACLVTLFLLLGSRTRAWFDSGRNVASAAWPPPGGEAPPTRRPDPPAAERPPGKPPVW